MTVPHPDAVLAAKGRSFHWARRLLGPVHAARATTLYAFCRHIDDLADEAACPQAARAALADALRAVDTGHSTDPALTGGLRLMRECRFDLHPVRALIAGAASDTHPVRIQDEAALLAYCHAVAGTVGLMMCRVLDVGDPAALPHAASLGTAMQLVNICRDVSEDAAAGRRYLPATLVGDLPPAALIDPAPELRPRLRQCVAALLDLADTHYRRGEQGLAYLPLGARGGILVAARLYRAIGTRLRQRDYAYWEGRAVVGGGAKAALTARALLTAPLRPQFWRPPAAHALPRAWVKAGHAP